MVWWVPIESQGNETTVRLKAVDIADEDRDDLVSFLDPTCPTRDELVLNLYNEGASWRANCAIAAVHFPRTKIYHLVRPSGVSSFCYQFP